MNKKIKISVVMASLNEEKAITEMIKEIIKNTVDYETEILLIDSSNDNTPKIAEQLGARVIKQPPKGHGIALRTAIKEATNDIIITTDCDNTYPMEYIPKLINLILTEKYDIISCNRLTKNLTKEMPFLNKIGNKFFAFLVRSLYKINVYDVSTGMFCLSKIASERLKLETNYSFPCEMLIKANLAGLKHKEIDIPYKLRIGEVTLNRWKSGKAYLKCIFNYRFNLGIDPKNL